MSKYKVGDKFIIEIDDVILGSDKECNNSTMYRIKGFNTLVFDRYGLDKLQQINPKLKIEDIDDMLAEHDLKKETYEKGLADAWELARKIYAMEAKEFDDVFGYIYPSDAFNFDTPQQALAKIEAYEESKAINVGDVVEIEPDEREWLGVAIGVYAGDNYYVLEKDGEIQTWDAEQLKKTGRHIDIENLLEQIRGNE